MKILTIDIGGTSIKSALYEDDILSSRKECNSYGSLGASYVLNALFSLIDTYTDYDGIGICTTGQVDPITGTILCENENIPGYKDLALANILEEKYKKKVWVENDVNAAAYGEAHYGCAIEISSFIMLTYGTGIGAAFIEKNEMIRGAVGFAGEVGHMITHGGGRPCNCGSMGCYETYASVTSLVEKVSSYNSQLDSGRKIFDSFYTGDTFVITLVNEWINEILYGLVNLVHIFNPSHIILGGGIMKQPYLIDRLRDLLPSLLMDGFQEVKLLQASLGNDAGLYGMVIRVESNHL